VAFYRFSSSGALLASALIPPDSTLVYPNAYDAVIEESGTVLVACRINPYTQDLLRLDMDGNILDRITLPGTILHPSGQYSMFLSHSGGSDYTLIVHSYGSDLPYPASITISIGRLYDTGAEYWTFYSSTLLMPSSLNMIGGELYLTGTNYLPYNPSTLFKIGFQPSCEIEWYWSNPNLRLIYEIDDPVHILSPSQNGSIFIAATGYQYNSLAVAKVLPTGLLPVDDEIQIPGPRFISAFPNPMKDKLTLRIGKSESSQALAHLHVYNLRGQLIRVLPVTQDEARWDGRDSNGKACPAGVYLIRDAAKLQAMQKITLLK